MKSPTTVNTKTFKLECHVKKNKKKTDDMNYLLEKAATSSCPIADLRVNNDGIRVWCGFLFGPTQLG
jgi:hypothetical protein